MLWQNGNPDSRISKALTDADRDEKRANRKELNVSGMFYFYTQLKRFDRDTLCTSRDSIVYGASTSPPINFFKPTLPRYDLTLNYRVRSKIGMKAGYKHGFVTVL